MKKRILLSLLFFSALPCTAENYLLNGGQESEIDYKMVQRVEPSPGIKKLMLSYVEPQTYRSPSYNQKITKFDLNFSIKPAKETKSVDARGNRIVKVTWENPKRSIDVTLHIVSLNSTHLEPVRTDAPFPLKDIPEDTRIYLKSTKMVPANNSLIKQKAASLVNGSETEFDAVQKVLSWVVDHMNYTLTPGDYSAIYAIKNQRGNCQNYSHLTATFLRAVGIPVRIVNGVTLKQPYNVKVKGGTLTMRMAQGRHSWIEIYFPDLGWVPFDPQQMQLFVSNRFIRVEVGLDNDETINDGSILWTRSAGSKGYPGFQELIDARFLSDNVSLNAAKQSYGPRKMLFSPPVEAIFSRTLAQQAAAAVVESTAPADLGSLNFSKPFEFGNLDFPEGFDFAQIEHPVTEAADGTMLMGKSFMVETAEYVTTNGHQFGQTFILDRPVRVAKIGLALQKFGGTGQLWVELLKDDGTGKPGDNIATSKILSLQNFDPTPGYRWIDFDFEGDPVILPEGRYWIALGFTGSPIVNWFFSYGKPTGPADGTRYKTIFDESWSNSLSYEFNYRIQGFSE